MNQVLRFFPPTLIFCLALILSYMCVRFSFFGYFIEEKYFLGTFFWFILSIFFILWIASFIQVIFGNPGESKIEGYYNKHNGCQTYCPKCGNIKPYRTHHCKKCNKCYVRMDHHCDALGVCIALRNHKSFILLILYSIISLSIFSFSSIVLMFIGHFESFPYPLLFNGFSGGSLAILLSFLLYGQLKTILTGRTVLENIYDIHYESKLSKYERFCEIFGKKPLNWFLPFPLSFDDTNGFKWEKDRKID